MTVWLLLALGCTPVKVDPLAGYRDALTAHESAPLSQDWTPHASLLLSNAALDNVLGTALSGVMSGGLHPIEHTMFGTTARMEPQQVAVVDSRLRADDSCERCMSMALTLSGGNRFTLSNITGKREQELPWTATVNAVFSFELSDAPDGAKVLQARAVNPTAWTAELTVQGVHAAWMAPFRGMFEGELQNMVRRPDLPAVTLTRLNSLGDAGVRDARARNVGDTVVIDFVFDMLTEPPAPELPSVEQGWALALPAQTLLGLIDARSLREPADLTQPALPKFTAIELSDPANFNLHMTALPTLEKGRTRELRLMGNMTLTTEGALALTTDKAVWADDTAEGVDLVRWLAGGQVLAAVADAAQGLIPVRQVVPFGSAKLVALPETLSVHEQVLILGGALELETDPASVRTTP